MSREVSWAEVRQENQGIGEMKSVVMKISQPLQLSRKQLQQTRGTERSVVSKQTREIL